MSILTKDQNSFLDLFSKDKSISNNFYLTGGTALAEFYIPYRYSDDLDFFSETEVDTQSVFTAIKKSKNGLVVDSPLDIATNKLFTIYQKPRSRDFMDLYMLNKKYIYTMENLISKASAKFDWHIDPIKLGAQFMLATELKDYPNLIQPLEEKEWQAYFNEQAEELKKNIFQQ